MVIDIRMLRILCGLHTNLSVIIDQFYNLWRLIFHFSKRQKHVIRFAPTVNIVKQYNYAFRVLIKDGERHTHLRTCSAAAWLGPGVAGGQAYACNTMRRGPVFSRRTHEQEPGASQGSAEPEMLALPVTYKQTPVTNLLCSSNCGFHQNRKKIEEKKKITK